MFPMLRNISELKLKDKEKERLKGSPSRDIFKQKHKENMPGLYYACDIDLALVSKYPASIKAILDYKKFTDKITFSEVIAYNDLMNHYPIFIIKSQTPENGPFYIYQYNGGNWHPEPPEVDITEIRRCINWDELSEWENTVRIRRVNQ